MSRLKPASNSASINKQHRYYLYLALKEAEKAKAAGDVPVGAIVVRNNKVISRGYNEKEVTGDTTRHAEMVAIQNAIQKTGDWRLNGCTLYSTLEPCPMCAGAILHARISEVIYGAQDLKWGAAGTVVNLFQKNQFNHSVRIYYEPTDLCSHILTDFFKDRRNGNKAATTAGMSVFQAL